MRQSVTHSSLDAGLIRPPVGRRRAALWAVGGWAAALAACGQATPTTVSSRQPLDAWDAAAQLEQLPASACDPTPPRLAGETIDHLDTPACVELQELPVVRAAAARCLESGGTYLLGALLCRCPPRHWLDAAEGCRPRPPPASSDPTCPDDLRGLPPEQRHRCAPSARLGGLRLLLPQGASGGKQHIETIYGALTGDDEALAADWALVGPATPDASLLPWSQGADLPRALPPALAAVSSRRWAEVFPPPAVATLMVPWRPRRQADARGLQQAGGHPQGACRRALADAGVHGADDDGHPCAGLAQLRDELLSAHHHSGHWRAVYEIPDRPAAGLTTIVAYPQRPDSGRWRARVAWLVAPPAVVHRRLHLQRDGTEMIAFVGPRAELIMAAVLRPEDGRDGSRELGFDGAFKRLLLAHVPLTGGGGGPGR